MCLYLSLIFIFVLISPSYTEIESCRKVISNGRNTLTCTTRILDKDTSFIGANDLSETLYIACNPLLLYESEVETNIFNKMTNLNSLSIKNCKILQLNRDSFSILHDLKRLKIKTANYEWSPAKFLELDRETFSGLSELQTLDLSDCNIKHIPIELFCNLHNLISLNLTSNRLKFIDNLGFGDSCGGNLQSLDLSHNEIRNIPEDSDLDKLRRLQNLYLQHNNITDISSESFNGLINLRVLNVSFNKLHTLPEAIFTTNRELRELHLHNNVLYNLAKGVFHRLEQLLILNLSNNELSSNHIDDNVFIGLIRLIVLNLSHNALTRIDGKSFKDLFFLQILDLRNNSIGFIEENAFLPLYNLHTLNLAENRLNNIDPYLFNGLFVLNKLVLNNNLIVKIEANAFKNCTNLKELDLSSNQIIEVPTAIWELVFLKTIDLGENQISTIKNGSFKNLVQLTGLRLIDNQIGNITGGMFDELVNLQVLNLAKNRIQSISLNSFNKNEQIEAIRLDGNFITDINGIFSQLKNLLWLNLSENHLVWFDYAFIPSKVKWLDIHSNFIEHLGNYYNMQEQLNIKTLDVSHNRLLSLSPEAIPNTVELLFVNNNFVRTIEVDTFYDKRDLIRVDAYSNELVYIELNSVRLAPVPVNISLPEFYMGGNPLSCDCNMEWLSSINDMTSTRQYPRVMDLENVMCKVTHSRSVTDVPLPSLSSKDFLCKYDTHCFSLCHCCDFDACDCEMTCPQNCDCFHNSNWATNIVDCSRRNIASIPDKIPMDVTELYLDGNYFEELQNHAFIGRKYLKILYVNASGIVSIRNKTFTGLTTLNTLHLEDNRLTVLVGYEFEHLLNLKELFLQNNLLGYISNSTFSSLLSLEVLRLDGNRLVDYAAWNLDNNIYLTWISLGNNPWSCRCKYLQDLTVYMSENINKIKDIKELWCWNPDSDPPLKSKLDTNITACTDFFVGGGAMINSAFNDYLPVTIATLFGSILILLSLIIIFVFRNSLRVCLFSSCGMRTFDSTVDDKNKLYDAYVCYSPKDEEFVVQTIANELENNEPSYSLCLHYRDVPLNDSIMNTAPIHPEAADASKRILLILTRNFLETEWSKYEFKQTLSECLRNCYYKLIIIIEEKEIIKEASKDLDLRKYLNYSSRLKLGDKRFWDKLKYLLPDCPKDRQRNRVPEYKKNITYGSVVASNHDCYDKTYHIDSDEIESSNVRNCDCRPLSDHIYSSIDSDYSTLERSSARSRERCRGQWIGHTSLLNEREPSYLV